MSNKTAIVTGGSSGIGLAIAQQLLAAGFTVAEIPVPVRYFPEASSMQLMKGFQFLHQSNILLVRYLLHRYRISRSPMFL